MTYRIFLFYTFQSCTQFAPNFERCTQPAPKSVREGILLALGTLRLRMIYTSVGVTSAFVFDRVLNFRRSKGQKQSLQCRFSTM